MEHEVVVTAVRRTPFGRFGGALAAVPLSALGSWTIDALLRRSDVDASLIEGVHVGVGMIAAGVLTPARRVVLGSMLDDSTPSLTVDRACCSGMTAIGLAARELRCGESGMLLAGGVEVLSTTPRLLPRRVSTRPGGLAAEDPLTLRAPFGDTAIAVYSGEEALAAGIDRSRQDAWALGSHRKYFLAEEAGAFDFEREPLQMESDGAEVALEADEGPRRDASLDRLARLKPVYGGPTVTAGNAPGLNDGAAFLMLATAAAARSAGLPILATIRGYAQMAGDRRSGTSTPAFAIRRLLARHDVRLEDLTAIEINEAYAATPLVSALRLAGDEPRKAGRILEKVNVHGGAVAIGHPLGASGARIVMSLVNILRRMGGGLGVAAICGGYGQGDAMLVEAGP